MIEGKFDRESCLAALAGQAVPQDMRHPLHRLCVISGMRRHFGYGEHLRGTKLIFTRSLNARCIMSNKIPDMPSQDEFPYCIWYPETASRDTYRKLLQRYPQMAYQIGRACAVAGYTDLYQELMLQPDVHIAEEARECDNHAIFDLIMAEPVRYSIMNDYTCSIHPEDRTPAYLTGDTVVRWMLDEKQGMHNGAAHGVLDEETGEFIAHSPESDWPGYRRSVFNITEDNNIAEKDYLRTDKYLPARLEIQLLSSPLPTTLDLPTVQKDLLILMAAYNGDIDRYVRLRRPVRLHLEELCICRGIYYNTLFALWWKKQPDKSRWIQESINARMIMNNILEDAPYDDAVTPYQIWEPSIAAPSTYLELAKVQPSMITQIMEAVISASYQYVFDELLPSIVPNQDMLLQADRNLNQYYKNALQERLTTLGVDPGPVAFYRRNIWSMAKVASKYRSDVHLDTSLIMTSFESLYDGRYCIASPLEFNLCLPEAWRSMLTREGWGKELDYEDFPLSMLRGEKLTQE